MSFPNHLHAHHCFQLRYSKHGKMKKSGKEKFHNLPYTATHGLGRSFRQGRQAGKRQTCKAAQVRVHRFGGKRRQRATRRKPNSPALLSMCVRSELCSRAPLFLPPLSVVCFLLYPAHHHHHHLSLCSCCWS